jgi:asparagine synthase (glutamine-hydrolysing)
MCGIAGLAYLDGSRDVDKNTIIGMARLLAHRGPDEEGFYVKKNVGLGFRRLSIIDLKTGHQPLSNEDGSVWIVFNGEIYNFIELRKNLEAQGHQFKTNTDTEVIVHLFEQKGGDCVRYLRGMFAFAIYDDRGKKLFCARDRFGIKPFYYHLDSDKFQFGSELKVVPRSDRNRKEINLSALDDYFAYGHILGEKTIYKDTKKLRPGHVLELDLVKKEHKIWRYWDIQFEPDYSKNEKEWCEEIDSALTESVEEHLVSDVPLGAFLSGGIDSSSVVALMSRAAREPVKTFSIGFKEQSFNELAFAKEIAKLYKTEHHERLVEPESVDLLPKLVEAFDEPFADSSAIPTYYVSQFAREYVKVVLSGDGGDELFAGYNWYTNAKILFKSSILPHLINGVLWRSLYQVIPSAAFGKGISYHLSKEKNLLGAHFTVFTQPERQNLYKPDFWREIKETPAELYKEEILRRSASSDFLSQLQSLDMRTYLVDDILTKVDRASMQNSLEVRVPILDHKFAELIFKIPSGLKLKGYQKKYIFKKAMSQYLPQRVICHKKQGFALPLSLWFKKELRSYIYDRLTSNGARVSEYLNPGYVRTVMNNHLKGMRDLNEKIWTILFLDAWLEKTAKHDKTIP